MADKSQPRAEGVTVISDFSLSLHIILKKTTTGNNILVGDHLAPNRPPRTTVECAGKHIEHVTDDMSPGSRGWSSTYP
jgi:hypothetical protein